MENPAYGVDVIELPESGRIHGVSHQAMTAVKEFPMNLRLISALLGSVLLLAACGTGSAGGDKVLFKREKFEFNETQPILEYGVEHAVPAPDISISLDGVPGLDELADIERNTSAPEPFFRLGSELADPGLVSHSVVNGNSLVMSPDWVREGDPPTSELAWAIYRFNLADYGGPGTLQLWWDSVIQPVGNLYIGVSDYSTNRWKWFNGPAADSAIDFGPLGSYFSETDEIYFAVLLTGQGDYSLAQLRLGPNLEPTAAFVPDVLSGQVPLTVSFDGSPSFDADGDIVSYEWDLLGDGNFGPVTDVSVAGHEYTQTGSYLVRLRVTDNEGGIGIAEQVIIVSPVENNLDPVADLKADKTSGTAPLRRTPARLTTPPMNILMRGTSLSSCASPTTRARPTLTACWFWSARSGQVRRRLPNWKWTTGSARTAAVSSSTLPAPPTRTTT